MSIPVVVRPQVSPRIREADAILKHAGFILSFPGGNARHLVQTQRDTLAAALDEHARLLNGSLDWRQYDPDLWVFGDGAEENAIEIAECKAAEAGRAVIRAIREHTGRPVAAMAGQGETR